MPDCDGRRWNNTRRWLPLDDAPPPVLRRVAWVHVPKTGGAPFANLLFRAACRATTPKPFVEPIEVSCIRQGVCPDAFVFFEWGHKPLPQPLRVDVQAVTVLRAPWSRATSGFFHNLHDCLGMQFKNSLGNHHPPPSTAAFFRNFSDDHVKGYARCVSGCVARMLTGNECGVRPRDTATATLLPVAEATLQRFAFVGIFEEWNATLRAFASTFRTPLAPAEYVVVRRGVRPSETYERVARVMRSVRFVDDALYARGRELFDARWRLPAAADDAASIASASG